MLFAGWFSMRKCNMYLLIMRFLWRLTLFLPALLTCALAGNINAINPSDWFHAGSGEIIPIPAGAPSIIEHRSDVAFAAPVGDPSASSIAQDGDFSPEDAVREIGLVRAENAERKLGGRAEALAPHEPHASSSGLVANCAAESAAQ